jgi:hypothetical protein
MTPFTVVMVMTPSIYAFDILNASATSTAVPEPASFIGTALAGFAVVSFKRKLMSVRDRSLFDR